MKQLTGVVEVLWFLFVLMAAFLAVVPLAALFGIMCFAAVALGVAALPFLALAKGVQAVVGDAQ